MKRQPLSLALIALALLAVSGCSTAKLAVHVAKSLKSETEQTRQTQPLPAAARDDYKLGSPYQIQGVWYYPSYEPRYDRTGVASWYGPAFHGRPTANGERFDMNAVSAAHPTLPLPSRVRVTNLENGRQLIVRVNDRGPFIDDRLIDLSRRGAQLLGFHRQGLAKVRVQYLGLAEPLPDVLPPAEKPVRLATVDAPAVVFKPRRSAPSAGADVLRPADKPVQTASIRAPPVAGGPSGAFLVEAAVFEERDAAGRLGALLRSFGTVSVEPERRGGRLVHAVRIGPFRSNAEAASILAELTRFGLTESQIIAAGYR